MSAFLEPLNIATAALNSSMHNQQQEQLDDAHFYGERLKIFFRTF